jgi:hypothetical protein
VWDLGDADEPMSYLAQKGGRRIMGRKGREGKEGEGGSCERAPLGQASRRDHGECALSRLDDAGESWRSASGLQLGRPVRIG